MKRRITQMDLSAFRSYAKDFYLQLPAGARLPGMTRALTVDEVRILSYLDAALTLLGNTDVDIVTEFPDSDVTGE